MKQSLCFKWDASRLKSPPPLHLQHFPRFPPFRFTGTSLYFRGGGIGTVRVECLSQAHNTIKRGSFYLDSSPARAKFQCVSPIKSGVLFDLLPRVSNSMKFSIMNWADNVNWPPKEFQTYVSSVSLSSERNVSFRTLYGGQFTLSTQFIILNYPVQYTLPLTQHHSLFRNLPLLLFYPTLE